MNGKLCKRLRKKIYGDKDFRVREYTDIVHSSFEWAGQKYEKITRVSDKERRWYQNAKKVYKYLKTKPKEKRNESNTGKDIE